MTMKVLGLDEVGRGSIAGPLVFGAVVLDKPIAGLKDSKMLSARQRQILAKKIYYQATATYLGWVSAHELDRVGLSQALRLAAARALHGFSLSVELLVLDGNINYLPSGFNPITLIGGDKLEPAVSAASIIAKVARDTYMINQANTYPQYGFDKHVGYCTRAHVEALQRYGVCPLHRCTFEPIKTLLGGNRQLSHLYPVASTTPAR